MQGMLIERRKAIEKLRSTSKKYPKKLLEVNGHPTELYVEGNIELLNRPSIAIVGPRKPSDYGKKQAARFAKMLSQKGICIVSGLARGIDTIAHINSMKNEGKTIAVIASGINNIYPPENRILAEKIIENGGAIVSEYEPVVEVEMSRFPRRNRIISGLADGILVVEARSRSGSTITATYGKKQKREVFCIPGNIDEVTSGGTNKLIQEGANLVVSYKDIIQTLGLEENNEIEIDGEYKYIYDMLGVLPISIDEIVARTGMQVKDVNEILFMLEVDGFIESMPGDKYVRKYN